MGWLVDIGTNGLVLKFLDNNSFLLIVAYGLIMLILKYRAKKTPSPEDDEILQEIDDKVKSWFGQAVKKRVNF